MRCYPALLSVRLNEFERSLIPAWKKIFPSLVLLVLSFAAIAQSPPYASHGTLNAKAWDFSQRLPLNGYWSFSPMQLIEPQECENIVTPKETYFPTLWNETTASGLGYATYWLNVLVPSSIDTFSLELPTAYSSYALWVNNEKIAINGKVGRSEKETTPQWLPQVVRVVSLSDTLHIVLQISNFQHHRGGIKDPIYLGLPEEMFSRYSMTLISNCVNTVCALIIGIAFMILYVNHGAKVVLYFALLCLSWSVRSMFSDPYSIIILFPYFDWFLATKTEYATLFLLNIFAIMFLNHLFAYSGKQGVRYFLITANCLFILITISFSPMVFTRWLPVYLVFSGVTIVYAIGIVLWATIHEQTEAWLLVISIVLGIITFSYDLISFQGFLPHSPMVLHTGRLLIFILMSIALLLRLGFIRTNKQRPVTILTYEDLFKEQ